MLRGVRGRRRRYHRLVPVAILLEGVKYFLGVGMHEVGPGLPERVDDVVDEADLRLLDGRVVSVAHRTDVQVLLALFVALLEELFHEQLDPAPVQRQRLRRVREVSAVHQVLQDL